VPSTSGALWAFFLTGALTVAAVLGAMIIFLVLAQRRTLALHRRHTQELLRAQEAERAWVAREVHDDAVQHLAAIANELRAILPEAVPSASAQRVEGMVGEVNDLAESLRVLAHRLHPSALDKGGAVSALALLAEQMHDASGFEVELSLPEAPLGLHPEVELCLFRVAQEALRNAARHAGVSRARVTLRRTNAHVELAIADQGAGMPATRSASRGIGLLSMQERARLAGGRLQVASRPGEGTTVQLTLPVPSAVHG